MDVSVSARPSNFTLQRTGRSRCSRPATAALKRAAHAGR